MSKNILTISVVVLACIIVAAGVLLLNNSKQLQFSPSPLSTSISTPATASATPPYPDGWKKYNSQEKGFTVAYPSEMSVSEREDIPGMTAINFNLIGETQTQGTELFDGISLSVTTGKFEGSFDDFVQSEYEEQQNDPTTNEISELREIQISNYQGYSFDVSSLGDYTHIYLPKRENEYLHIYYIAPDPENLGYSETVNTMLSSLKMVN